MPTSTCRTREAVLERGRTDCAAASCEELRRWRFQGGEAPPNRNEPPPGTGEGAGMALWEHPLFCFGRGSEPGNNGGRVAHHRRTLLLQSGSGVLAGNVEGRR